jgi:hypothetical protein
LRGAASRQMAMAGATAMAQATLIKGAVRQALGPAKLDEETLFFRALARGILREAPIAALVASARGLVGKDERKLAKALAMLGKGTGL